MNFSTSVSGYRFVRPKSIKYGLCDANRLLLKVNELCSGEFGTVILADALKYLTGVPLNLEALKGTSLKLFHKVVYWSEEQSGESIVSLLGNSWKLILAFVNKEYFQLSATSLSGASDYKPPNFTVHQLTTVRTRFPFQIWTDSKPFIQNENLQCSSIPWCSVAFFQYAVL